jgi:hypothetical protein
VLDDGSRENDIGIGGTWEFIWVNRFTPSPADFPFNLTQVQVYFSSVGMVHVGDQMVLAVYENTSGNYDPAVGSNFLASFPVTVQAVDAWNVYNLPVPVALNGPGDVAIGVIAMTVPGTSYWPASIDQTATQQRSWAGWWNTSPPPDPPLLPPDASWILIDDYFPGNWMVRGYGETGGVPDIPWLSENPTSGTVPPGQCADVTVTFDSTGLAAGDYFGSLAVASNDPDEPVVTVPVQLTVVACGANELHINRTKIFQHPSAPMIVKVVTQCEIFDQNGMPVPGATMAGEWTLPDLTVVPGVPFYGLTDAKGHEKFRLQDTQSGDYQFCVTAITAPGFQPWPVGGYPGDPDPCLSIDIN